MAASRKAKKKTTARKAVKKTVRKAAKKTKPPKGNARQAPAEKPRRVAPKRKAKQIVGEGDYAASRAFLKDQAGFVKKNKAKIPAMAKAAKAALEGSEGPALMAAEAQARSHGKTGSED